MNCFPCFSSKEEEESQEQKEAADAPADTNDAAQPSFTPPPPQEPCDNRPSSSDDDDHDDNDEPFDADEDVNSAKAFTFRELASAAKNFRQECLIGEGGYGRVFKGTLQCSGQIVCVRKLDRSGTQESKEFEVDVLRLSLLHHQNLVRLIGYCAEGDQRLLVYEYMPTGSLTKHLFDIPADKKPLHWSARMRVAAGIAQGLEYLHEKANPPIIYCDLKSSNILLDETNNPRLSEYGLAKLLHQSGSKMHLAPKTAASGYCAPEYERNGDLTFKSDVYSFGVVLLELISGRRALDSTRPVDEENLVTWVQPFFRDPRRFPDMADPLLKGEFSVTSLNQVVGVAAMCLQEEPEMRPMISDIVAALSFLAMAPPNAPIPARIAPILSTRVETLSRPVNAPNFKVETLSKHKKDDSSDSEDEIENDQELQPNDDSNEDEDSQNSDHDCTDSSESDIENKKVVVDPNQNKSSKKFKESAKWSSSSKRRSKEKSEGTRSITSSSGSGGSIGSTDSSVGFSLRCDSAYPERNFHSDSRQDYRSGSSSDEESVHESFKSRSGHGSRNRRLKSMNSSNKDLHNKSLGSNKSSSSKRQNSSGKSSSSHSRKYDNVESESDESDFVYSRHSSSAGSDYGEHSQKHEEDEIDSPKNDEDETHDEDEIDSPKNDEDEIDSPKNDENEIDSPKNDEDETSDEDEMDD